MSWFGTAETPKVVNIAPVTSSLSGFGELSEKDTAWACSTSRGFQAETQIWYSILEDGSLFMLQLIWNYTGVFLIPATTQITMKIYNPKTQKTIWRSLNASGFKPNGKSAKANEFEVKHTGTPTTEEVYDITASLDKTCQVTLKLTKPADAPGFKLGAGPEGGYTTFGKDRTESKRDGFVIHRWHPLVKSAGTVVVEGQMIDLKGEAMFVNAIQGMRPDSVASRWNFAFFTTGGGSELGKLGVVRAVQMEFSTTDDYGPLGAKSGRTKVNLGAVYIPSIGPSPLIVTGQTHTPDSTTSFASEVKSSDVSVATHVSPATDKETGYPAPAGVSFEWEGDRRDGKGRAGAKVVIENAGAITGQGGLMEKVDVLAEIPYVIRKALASGLGIKPVIYQYLNPATLEVTLDGENTPVAGHLFNEASFISM